MENQDYEQTRPIDIFKMRVLVFGTSFAVLVLITNLVHSYLFTSASQAKYLYTDNMIKNYMLSKLDVPKGPDGVNDDGQIRLVGNSKHLQSIYKIEGTNFSIGSDLTDEAREKCGNIPEFEREHFTRNNTFIRASLDQLKIYSISKSAKFKQLEKPFLRCFDQAFQSTPINEKYLRNLMLVVNNPDVKSNLLLQAQIQQAKSDGIIDYFEYIQIYSLATSLGSKSKYGQMYSEI